MLGEHSLQLPLSDQLYLFVLEKGDVEEYWEEIEPLVVEACNWSYGTFTPEILHRFLLEGRVTCFGTERDGKVVFIFIVMIHDYPTYRAGAIIAAAGKELKAAFKWLYVLEEWAFSQGAVELEAWCRPVMVRLLREYFQPKTTIVTRSLRRKLQ